MIKIKNGEFVKETPQGLEPYIPILVANSKVDWVFGGETYYHYAKKFGLLGAVNPICYKKLREYLLAAWGPDAIYGGISSPTTATKLELPFLSNLTQMIVRNDKLCTPIDIGKLSVEAASLIRDHPTTAGWNLVEPAWEALAAGNDPSFVAKQIIEICRVYKIVAPDLPIFWNECGSYHEGRNFTKSNVGRVFEEVMSSEYCPEALGSDSYPVLPSKWDGPAWWNLVTDSDGKAKPGVPVLGISECGWQPNETIEPNWNKTRAKRLGVSLPSEGTKSKYAPIPGTDQNAAFREGFRRWSEFNRKAINEFGAKFISWHSVCGHGGSKKRDGSSHWTAWGPIDGVSGYWHPASDVRLALEESF